MQTGLWCATQWLCACLWTNRGDRQLTAVHLSALGLLCLSLEECVIAVTSAQHGGTFRLLEIPFEAPAR